MKINFILPGYPVRPVGGFRVIYELSNELCKRGHDVHVTHTNSLKDVYLNRSSLKSIKKSLAFIYYNIISRKVNWMYVNPKIKLHYLKDLKTKDVEDSDIVFATAWQTSEYVKNLPASKGKKYYFVMNFDPFDASKEKLTETWLYPMTLITISQWLCNKILDYSNKKAYLVPLGINKEIFNVTNTIEDRKNIISMMYSKVNYKDAKTGIKALSLCIQNIKGVECIVFGPANKRPENLPKEIKYVGNVTDTQLAKIYNSSAIFISSSIMEGFAFPAAEAMACGCAVASTDCGGNRDYAKDKVNALISNHGDFNTLYENIKKLIENKSLRFELANNGIKSINSYTWGKCADMLLEVVKY